MCLQWILLFPVYVYIVAVPKDDVCCCRCRVYKLFIYPKITRRGTATAMTNACGVKRNMHCHKNIVDNGGCHPTCHCLNLNGCCWCCDVHKFRKCFRFATHFVVVWWRWRWRQTLRVLMLFFGFLFRFVYSARLRSVSLVAYNLTK